MLLYKISYFQEPYTHSKNKIKVELDLSYYAIGIDTSKFAENAD